MSNSVEKIITHYQRDIEKITSKPERSIKYADRLLHCLSKLDKLPITVTHLQTTGVGKTVNSLRKLQLKNGVPDAAKALVSKWKNMVIEEDDSKEADDAAETEARLQDSKKMKILRQGERSLGEREYSPEQAEGPSVTYTPSYAQSTRRSYSPEHLTSNSTSELKDYSPSKKAHQPNGYSPGSPGTSSIEVYCYSPSKKVDKKEEYSAIGESSKTSREKKDKSHSSYKGSSSRDTSSSHQGSSRASSSKSHSSSSSKSKSSDKKPSSSSNSKSKKEEMSHEGIDSQSGASFAQALGPMVVKKTSSSLSSSSKKRSVDTSDKRSSSPSSSKKSRHSSSQRKHEATPFELLDDVAGPSHLSPLDMDVVSTLSTPTPNYRPMPQPPLTSSERRQRAQEEEDALSNMMSNRNKNSRTKVYSGVKGGYSYVPSLYAICCDVLKVHIDALEYTGGIPYSLLKPVLDSATPAQLYQFEHYNPYIIGDTDHLWKFHVSKEFRVEMRDEMETWRDMYLRCMDEREEKYKAVTANIQKSIKTSVPVRQTKLAYVDVAKPPRSVLRKQMKNGTGKPEPERLMGKATAEAVVRPPPPRSIDRPRVNPIFKPKVAPLMQKTLKSIKMSRLRR